MIEPTLGNNSLVGNARVCLVGNVESERKENDGRMEKWKDRKYFNLSHFCLVGSEKVEGQKKISFYKFTHTHLLKSDDQLKQKSDKKKRRSNHRIY